MWYRAAAWAIAMATLFSDWYRVTAQDAWNDRDAWNDPVKPSAAVENLRRTEHYLLVRFDDRLKLFCKIRGLKNLKSDNNLLNC